MNRLSIKGCECCSVVLVVLVPACGKDVCDMENKMMSFGQLTIELEKARAMFKDQWRMLNEDIGPERLDAWGINIKPLLKQQKKMIFMLGSEVDPLDNENCTKEMLKLNEVYDSYCPDGKIPTSFRCQLWEAKKLQDKMNKTCAAMLKKAQRKEAMESKTRDTIINMPEQTVIEEGASMPPPSQVPMEQENEEIIL